MQTMSARADGIMKNKINSLRTKSQHSVTRFSLKFSLVCSQLKMIRAQIPFGNIFYQKVAFFTFYRDNFKKMYFLSLQVVSKKVFFIIFIFLFKKLGKHNP